MLRASFELVFFQPLFVDLTRHGSKQASVVVQREDNHLGIKFSEGPFESVAYQDLLFGHSILVSKFRRFPVIRLDLWCEEFMMLSTQPLTFNNLIEVPVRFRRSQLYPTRE